MPNDLTTLRRVLKTFTDLFYEHGHNWPAHQAQDIQTTLVELRDLIDTHEGDFAPRSVGR